MLSFDIRSNAPQVFAALSDLQRKHLPRAQMNAANRLGAVVHTILRKEMEQVFDRPTWYTLRGLDWRRATTSDPVVRIWLDEYGKGKGGRPAEYLTPQIEGGARKHKRFERVLIAKGLMPSGMFAVPGAMAPIDAYGNVPGSFITRMLSDLQAFGEVGYGTNRKGARKGRRRTNYFFVPRAGHTLPPGVWWHTPAVIGPVFLFVRAPIYLHRFDFKGVGLRACNRYAARFLTEELARLVRSDNRS